MGLVLGRRKDQIIWIGDAKVIVKEFYNSPSGDPAVSLLIEAPNSVIIKRDEIVQREYLTWKKLGWDYVSQGGYYRVIYEEDSEPMPYKAVFINDDERKTIGYSHSTEHAKKVCTAHHRKRNKIKGEPDD